ncbi:MAG: RCC1 domain-containing protein [Polyangiaceae bacterium]|nr:RCC1 domain-containing protein [Polyangiaceae bacterium]
MPVETLDHAKDFVSVTSGWGQNLAVDTDGYLWGWGDSFYGEALPYYYPEPREFDLSVIHASVFNMNSILLKSRAFQPIRRTQPRRIMLSKFELVD